ncbi:MAG: FkbM family methyltransferase [Rhodobacteraceae bacterium]|nr:FkbM family methyltransferase [Paracoccaceae bacterium]
MSDDASHSVDCLFDADNRMIIGIEPHPGNLRGLRFGVPKFHSMSTRDKIIRKGNNVKNIPDLEKRFVIIQGAAGSSDAPIERTFYSAYPDKGNSSLYKIQTPKSTGNIVDQEFNVLEFPLSLLFPEIDKAGFSFVESLKIDTEGHDLEVLKGAGLEIKKVLFCRVECFKGIYENSQYADPKAQPDHIVLGADGYHDSASAIVDYLKTFNFKLVSSRPGDYVFLNLDLEHLLTEYELYP